MTRTAWPLSPVIPAPAISNGACRRGISKKARPRSRPLCAKCMKRPASGRGDRFHRHHRLLVHRYHAARAGLIHRPARNRPTVVAVEGDPDHEAEDAIWVRFEDLDDVLSYPSRHKKVRGSTPEEEEQKQAKQVTCRSLTTLHTSGTRTGGWRRRCGDAGRSIDRLRERYDGHD